MSENSSSQNYNFAQLLRIPFQALVAELHTRLADAGFGDVRPTHTIIFAHVGTEGMRLNELAERAQLSKQVINYLVSAVEEMGYVERVPDPEDRRGKIVRLTEKGLINSQTGRQIIQDIEKEWTAKIGEEGMHELRYLLERLTEAVQNSS